MFKYSNLGIVAVLVAVVGGGILAYQHSKIPVNDLCAYVVGYDIKGINTEEYIAQINNAFEENSGSLIGLECPFKINNIDYNFVFTKDSIKITDTDKIFLQEIKIGADEMEMANYDLKRWGNPIITANADANFDSYKDLAIEIGNGYGGVNFFFNFYLFDPSDKKFKEVAELRSVCNPDIRSEERRILSSCKSGPGYEDTIYQFDSKNNLEKYPSPKETVE